MTNPTTLVPTGPALAVSLTLSLFTSSASADILFNADIVNTTGNVANDFHVKMVSSSPIHVGITYESGGDVVFPDALDNGGVEGNGTNEVTVNWVGATVNQGQMAHFGVGTTLGSDTPDDLVIKESWWTFGGAKLVSASSGRLASADFEGVGDWVVARVELFDSPDIFAPPIGTEWIEGRGQLERIYNMTDEPIFARLAFLPPSPDIIPIEFLNGDLGGFGPAGDMMILLPEGGQAFCEPAGPNSISPFGARLASLGGYGTAQARFLIHDVPDQFGVLFTGQNPQQLPFGCGQLCVGGSLVRFGPFLVQGGSLVAEINMTFPVPGNLVQFWYRDPLNAPNCGQVFNLSNALQGGFGG